MTALKRVHNKTIKTFKSSTNNFSREAWVEQVLKIASLKYNLEESDIENYVEKKKGKR